MKAEQANICKSKVKPIKKWQCESKSELCFAISRIRHQIKAMVFKFSCTFLVYSRAGSSGGTFGFRGNFRGSWVYNEQQRWRLGHLMVASNDYFMGEGI